MVGSLGQHKSGVCFMLCHCKLHISMKFVIAIWCSEARMWKWNHKHIVDHVQSRVVQPSLFTAKNELTKNGKRSCRYVDVLSTFSSILALHISSLEGNVLVFLSQIILNIIFLLSSPILRRAWCQWSSRIELKAIWGTIKRRGCWTWKHRLEFCEPRDIW